MRLQPVLQPFDDQLSMFEALSALFESGKFTRVVAVVAWARMSGLSRLERSIRAFRDAGGTAEVILGVDEGGATVEGLTAAFEIFDDAMVLYDRSAGTFHPKLWLFVGDECAAIIIGSNNLTAGGLYANYEAALLVKFDLTSESDRTPYEEIIDYVERLRSDGTSRSLNTEFIERLRESAEITINDEQRDRSRLPSTAEIIDSSVVSPAAQKLFGASRHRKKRDPLPRPGPAAGRSTGSAGLRARQVGNTPLIGASNVPAIASWSKKLTRSDCGRPNPGSNTTNALRFTKFGHDIDQSTWFRHELFGDAEWTADPTRPDREHAIIRFDVTINGVARGTHELELKYDRQRESGQRNFTTDLKWGSLTPVLREVDLVGDFVYIDKHEDGALTMRIEPPLGLKQGK